MASLSHLCHIHASVVVYMKHVDEIRDLTVSCVWMLVY